MVLVHPLDFALCKKRGAVCPSRSIVLFFSVFGAWICFGLRMIALSGLKFKNMDIVCIRVVRSNMKR